jgi:hypothetical protein
MGQTPRPAGELSTPKKTTPLVLLDDQQKHSPTSREMLSMPQAEHCGEFDFRHPVWRTSGPARPARSPRPEIEAPVIGELRR